MANTIAEDFYNQDEVLKEKYKERISKIADALHFFWVAKLKDGTEIAQYDANGTEVLFKEVMAAEEAGNLESFWWIPIAEGLKSFGITLQAGERLIARRRGYVTAGPGAVEKHRRMVYLLGVQKTIEGKNVKKILFIDQEGNTVVSDDFNYNFI